MFQKCVCGSAVLLVLCLAQGSWAQQMGAWTFDDGAGTTAKDSSGNGNNGRLIGGPTWVLGKFGKALKFDGVDDYVEISHNVSLLPPGNEETVSAWIYAERYTGPNNAQWQGVLSKGDAPRLYSLYTDNGGQNLHFSTGPSGAYVGTVSTTKVTLNQWIHVAIVVKDGQHNYYIDGEPAGTSGTGVVLPAGNTSAFRIGNTFETDRCFKGMIDEVRLYNFAMTPAEIKELFNGNPPKYPKAKKPSPPDGAMDVTMPLMQWTAGEGAVLHNVYFGTTPDLTEANLVASRTNQLLYFSLTPLTPGVMYYWRVDEINAAQSIATGDVWHFLAMPVTAYLPQPADGGGNIPLSPIMRWTGGQGAVGHHVYFGADRQAVEAGATETDKGKLDGPETWYHVTDTLKPDATFFWRVDEIGLGGTIQTGPIWSFDTVLAGPVGAIREWWSGIGAATDVNSLTTNGDYPDNPTGSEFVTRMQGPVDWADGYGTRIFGWVYPPQSGDYTFWISSDDGGRLSLSTDEDPANKRAIATVVAWTASEEWGKEANQRSQTIKLEAGKRYYIEALQKEGSGGDNIAVAWQGPGFTQEVLGAGGVGPTPYLPQRAYSPSPADGAVDTVQSVTLTWNAGEKAVKHELYFGDDANAVAAADTSSGLFKGSLSNTSYDAGALEWGKTFFWRVDEINTGDPESPWVGRVWKFTTANFIPVEDFESYDDVEGTSTRIYETWIDGYSDDSSGSTVGNLDPPFAETTIVHSGNQSMPMDYNNFSPHHFSEAYRDFSPVMNWTGNGVTDLSLWIRGWPVRLVEDPAGTFTVSANSVDIWGTSDNFRFVYKTLTGDGAISAKVISMTNTSGWAKAGVMMRESLDPASSYAFMFPTPDGRRAFQNRPSTGASALSAHSATGQVTLPVWVKVERKSNQFTAYYSTDGSNWIKQPANENTGADASTNPQSIIMGNSIVVGLAVASNNTQGGLCTAVFSDVVVTGGASFQIADLGSIDPGNDPDRLYLTVQDSANKTVTVAHPDAGAVNFTDWTEWKIPLSDLSGVSLNKVKRLYIGVGDKANPVQDGTGRIYLDDIRVTRP